MKKKYFHIGVTAFCVVCACILFFFLIFKAGAIFNSIGSILSHLVPIAYGIVLAYLLLPLNNWLNKSFVSLFSKRFKKEKRVVRTSKILSTTISILFALIVVTGLVALVAPQFWNSVTSLINTMPDTLSSLNTRLNESLADRPVLKENISELLVMAETKLREIAADGKYLQYVPNVIDGITTTISALISFAENIIVGVIVAIYVLNNTKLFAAQAKKLTYSLFNVKTANSIIHNFRYTHKMIGGFINGRLLDSLIIGILCFIGMTVLRIPYPVLISVIVGITNIIPFFGPFIGAIPSTVLILTVDPKKAFWFVIFIIVLQQFDGNILGPKISSNLTGLSGFWVMFALLLFGGLFGIWGMLLGVPIFAVIKTIFAQSVNKRLKRKSMPVTTYSYMTTDFIEPIVTVSNDDENSEKDDKDDDDDDDDTIHNEDSAAVYNGMKKLSNKLSERFKK